MGHGDIQQFFHNLIPLVDLFVIGVSPMEEIMRVKHTILPRIGKINGLCGIHGHEYLYQREDALRKDSFVRISFYLIAGHLHIHTRFLQFYMNHWHTIDKKHKVATAIRKNLIAGFKAWLTCYLVNALTSINFSTVINIKYHFFMQV